MSGETGGGDGSQAAMRSMDELGTPHNIQMGRLFYHFRSTTDPAVSHGTVVVPQMDWEGVRNEMERLSVENQRLKDIIISMHLNPPATVNYRSYQGHASSSSTGNGHNLERIVGAGSLTSISSVASPGSIVRHGGSVADDSVSISSLSSDQTADTEGPKTDTAPAISQPDESLDCVGLETSSDISYNTTSENEVTLDESDDSLSDCSTVRIIEVEDAFSDSESAEVEDQKIGVNKHSGHEDGIHIGVVSESDSGPEYPSRLRPPNNPLNVQAISSTEQDQHGTTDFWVNQRNNTRSSGRLNYDVPEDFDPEQDDVLSDVETVRSDEALTAWGIEGETASKEKQLVTKGIEHESTCSDDEEGWEEFPKEINSAPNLRLCNFQTLPIPTSPGNIPRAIGNIKTESRYPGDNGTSAVTGDRFSTSTIKTPMDYKVHAIVKIKENADSHEVLVDQFEEKKSEIDERDEIFQDKQHRPQSSAFMLDLRSSQEEGYAVRRKNLALAPANCTGTRPSSTPHPKLFSDSSTPRSIDAYSYNMTPLIPVTLTSPTGYITQSQKSVEWMHLKPEGTDDSARTQPSSKIISENERILSPFDPTDDVLSTLKSKGEKNTLEASNITKSQVKAINKLGNDEGSTRIPGTKEMQLQTLKERSQGDIGSGKVEHTVDKMPQTRPKVSLKIHTQEILAKDLETPVINKPSPSVPPTVNFSAKEKQTKATKASLNMPNRVPKASHRISSPTAFRNRGSKATASPMVVSPKEPSRLEEPELHHKKSIRFCDALTSNPMKPESQATKVDGNKPLVSILKSTPAESLTHFLDNNRIYNYEYIREVIVYNLPNDITLSSLLRQVSGGLLEKALIDPHDLSARLVFVEPEAARRFYNHIHRIGFFVHTEIPAVQFSLKERFVQCNLRGFIWTNHSCEIPVHMIQNIWKHGITRCLIISNFPRDIGVMRLIEDVLELLNLPAVEAKYIIEGASIDRDLSSTSVFVRIGFSCIHYAFRVCKGLSTYSPLYSSVSVTYDKDPCGGLIGNEPPSCWTGGKETGNDKPAVQPPAAKPRSPVNKSAPLVCTATPQRPTMNVRADIVALWNQFDDKSQPVPVGKGPVNPHATVSAPPVADISIAFKGFSILKKKTRKSPGEPNPNITHEKTVLQKAQLEKGPVQDTPSPAVLEQVTYDNWGVGLSTKAPQPPLGAHWNYGGQEVAREYKEAITKRARRIPEFLNIPDEKPKIENSWSESPLIDRIVHLKNLPRTFHVARLFRFIRGGMVEHVELKPPNSQYNTSSAIIVFVDPDSVKSYQSYLKSPGLTVEKNQRVVFAENIRLDIVENIRSLGHHGSRTRCLHIESLPKDTMLGEFLGIIEENMNHCSLEFEHAAVRESKDCCEAFLRLFSIGTAVFVAQVLERNYTGITITYDRDPCEGPVEELDEINLELR